METYTNNPTGIIEKAKALFGKQVDAIVRQEQKVVELVKKVGEKLSKLAENPRVKMLTQPIMIFTRMIKAHFSGEYKIAFSTLGLIVLAMVYFLSPIDLIPDFLGFLGFADDLSIVLAVYAKVKDEVSNFLDWEKTRI